MKKVLGLPKLVYLTPPKREHPILSPCDLTHTEKRNTALALCCGDRLEDLFNWSESFDNPFEDTAFKTQTGKIKASIQKSLVEKIWRILTCILNIPIREAGRVYSPTLLDEVRQKFSAQEITDILRPSFFEKPLIYEHRDQLTELYGKYGTRINEIVSNQLQRQNAGTKGTKRKIENDSLATRK